MTSPLIQALAAHFDSVFYGPNGDYPAVMEALHGITAQQALWKPAPSQNSIWQIVEHLIGSKNWLTEMLKGNNPASPRWTEPGGDEAAWQATVARLKETHERLKAALQAEPEPDMMEVAVAEWGRTMLELVLSSGPAHESHHGGQIDYLKGLQRLPSATSSSQA
jgi:hypothetical protein